MCQCDGQTVDCLLLHCKLAFALWCEVFHVYGVHWIMLKTGISSFCLEELVWEAPVNYLEYDTSLSTVVVW